MTNSNVVNRWRHLQHACALCCLLFTGTLAAQAPTAEQVEQFRRLPPAEQQRLARQLGVDLDQFNTPQHDASSAISEPLQPNSRRSAPHAGDSSIVDSYRSPLADNPQSRRTPPSGAPVEELTDDMDATRDATATPTPAPVLRQFGYDLFTNNPDAFSPVVDIPPPNTYVLGPGDTLVVQLYGKENANYPLVISRDGEVQFPELGPIAIAGQTISEARDTLLRTVEQQMIGVKAAVTMGPLRSIRVFVLGEAAQPGSYTVSSLSTITNALFVSGGITPVGSLRTIQLKRQGTVIGTLDLYDLLLHGDTSDDQRLMPGDVIFIPPIGQTLAITGEVKRPAIYELKSENTASAAVALAGGYLPGAYPKVSRIQRIDQQGNRTVLDVDLTQSSGQSQRLRNGDHLQIFSVLETLEKVVTVSGHVKRAGISQWHADLRIADVLPSVLDLLPNPDLEFALIKREHMPTREITVLAIKLGLAIENPAGAANIALQPRDEIIVFEKSNNRIAQLKPLVDQLNAQGDKQRAASVVYIGGQVRAPGEYPLPQNFSVHDLIQLAGDLTEKAYGLSAELTRTSYGANDQQIIEHLSIDLSDGDAAKQLILRARDELTIKRLPNFVGNEFVEIAGEVAFPGRYRIKRGETISELLKRAGGLSDHAFPQGAIFQRESLKIIESQRLREMRAQLETDIAISKLNEDTEKSTTVEAESLLSALDAIKPTGRMVINIPAVIAGDATQDVPLQDGDVLTIPQTKAAITVVGEVQYATSHVFQAKLKVDDYIGKSGGTTRNADKARIYVVKANGQVEMPVNSKWYRLQSQTLTPGDTIVVPINPDHMKPLELWSDVAQIVYQVALGAAAVASF